MGGPFSTPSAPGPGPGRLFPLLTAVIETKRVNFASILRDAIHGFSGDAQSGGDLAHNAGIAAARRDSTSAYNEALQSVRAGFRSKSYIPVALGTDGEAAGQNGAKAKAARGDAPPRFCCTRPLKHLFTRSVFGHGTEQSTSITSAQRDEPFTLRNTSWPQTLRRDRWHSRRRGWPSMCRGTARDTPCREWT